MDKRYRLKTRRIPERSAPSNRLGQECIGCSLVDRPVAKESTLNYTHLTLEERYQIHALCSQGIGVAAIAGHLGRHRSTIGRELSRNVSEAGYDPSKAHAQARE
ncbi:hypothetical protein DTW89_14295, partial [Acidovorax sp. BoFeN1]